MFRIVRTKTIYELEDLREAVLLLRDPDADHRPAQGCCGCGTAMCDVILNPPAVPEGYCWSCLDRLAIYDYTVLPGREP